MKDVWAAIMLVAGGLLAEAMRGRVVTRPHLAPNGGPRLRGDFDETICRTDIVQSLWRVNLGRSLLSVASFALLVLTTIV